MELKKQLETAYRCEKVLKERENGVVWLLRSKADGSRRVFREYDGDGTVYERLRNVACPNLPIVEAVEVVDGHVRVLEEYIQGDSLHELLKGSRLTEAEAVQIALQLCKALEVLHGLGAVHRDIKPSNIILRGDQAVLIDFDAARIQKPDQSGDTRVMGTTGYAAPEQYGFAQTDARTDIYAMGVLLNVMLTGQHPSKVLAKGRLRPVIETCIAVNADQRYPSAKALAQALTAKKPRRWPWLAGLAAVLVCLAAVLLPREAPAVQELPIQETPAELPESVEEPTSEPEPISEPEPEPEQILEPEPNPRQEALNAAIRQIWEEPHRYWMEFHYDLDGDGTEEPYIFAPYVDGFPDMIVEWDTVSRDETDNSVGIRTVAPGVWQGTLGGPMEPVPEFASLLENPETLVYCLEQTGEQYPAVWPTDSVGGAWMGGASMEQHRSGEGQWLFRVTAKLGDLELEGYLLSRIEVKES